MRREFILVLLGIICISTLSSFLSGYVPTDNNKILLDTVVGAVGAGNFSYWQLGHTGPLLVELTSITGDADLYVSDTVRPSYETDKNNFSSATCGPDIVSIPPQFPRPIGIGVFGHWSHYLSQYSLQVFLDATEVRTEEKILTIEIAQREAFEDKYKDLNTRKDKPGTRKTDEDPKSARYLKFFSVLDMIFEMFVL